MRATAQVGYIAASVLFSSDDESIPFILETIRHDLHSNLDPVQCMALSALANIGGTELCTALVDDVKQLVMSRVAIVRKKAALCMLRILRVKPSLVPVSEWASPLLTLLDDKNLGVVMSVVSFILGLATIDPEPFIAAVPHIILHLTRLAKNNACTVDYLYYSTANPWLQVRRQCWVGCGAHAATDAPRVRCRSSCCGCSSASRCQQRRRTAAVSRRSW